MKIKNVLLTKSYTGFYFDDQRAIKAGAGHDGMMYVGKTITEGFQQIRQPGEAVSIQLILEDGTIAYGDCAAVQYSGAGGRDPLFLASDFIPFMEKNIVPMLIGEDVSAFRPLAEKYDSLQVNGKRLHTALRYGLTQSFLDAAAKANHCTMAEIIRKEYNINDNVYKPVPVFAQSGDDRYMNADKMILKEADVLPHALINNVKEKLGEDGHILKEYVQWLRDRILKWRVREDYNPIFHIDVYGTMGIAWNNDVKKIANYIMELEQEAKPFTLRIEGPVDAGNREDTMCLLRDIRKELEANGSKAQIVADEWCNTFEDVKYFADNKAGHMLQVKTPDLGGVNNIAEALIYCKDHNIGAYCGGTCNETNISAECTTNIGIACSAAQVLAKPGMGVDEGYMIVKNEMNRVIALANLKK